MNINFQKINRVFKHAEKENRNFLLEHEVYQILKEAQLKTPACFFIKKGKKIEEKNLSCFKGNKVVLKIVAPHIVHKTDVQGVQIIDKDANSVNKTCKTMLETIPKMFQEWMKTRESSKSPRTLSVKEISQEIRGVLVCEKVDYNRAGFGNELLIGLENSREFGPIVTMGVGGIEIEYLSKRIKEGKAISIGSTHLLQKKDILGILEPLAVFDKLVGKVRGKKPLLTKEKLIKTYSQFQQLGNYYSSYNAKRQYVIEELEVNPFVVQNKELIALDGMARFSTDHQPSRAPIFENIKYLLKPKSIGIIGVSEKMNIGHIILNNILKSGFNNWDVTVVKPRLEEIEGCACVPTIADLPKTVDLFVLAVSAEHSLKVMKELMEKEKARSVIIIAGGIGEKKGTQALEEKVKTLLKKNRKAGKVTPVVNGGNCLGIYAKPGKYDTTFVPDYKLPRLTGRETNLVYLSQSGAFMISRMSKLPNLEPLYAISIGNQIDLTVSDYMNYFADDEMAKVFGIYMEGFLPGDGLALARAATKIVSQEGKMIVLYKAGRTPEGQAATASHTASVAGNYKICRSILEEVGVIVADTIFEFENYVKNLSFLAHKVIRGNRIAIVSNAGFECVTMADNLKNDLEFHLATFSPKTHVKISSLLEQLGIHHLQDVSNPLDLTPVADDFVFAECVRVILEDKNVDCAVVSPVPMTPAMHTLIPGRLHRENLYHPQSIAMRLIDVFHKTDKPFVVNLDAGDLFNPMVDCLEQAGVPTFRRSDIAVKFLRKYINNRLKIRKQYLGKNS